MKATLECSVDNCGRTLTAKDAKGLCARHYSYLLRTGSPFKPCAGCGQPLGNQARTYCSDDCKPRCSIEGCNNPARKKTWCASHYHQAHRSGKSPVPFRYKWADKGGRCLNCDASTEGSIHRRFCSDACRVSYRTHGSRRPSSTACVACGVAIDLMTRGRKGQLRKTNTKFCVRCKRDYNKYKMSVREIAKRDGVSCGICGGLVDMSLTRANGLDCPSVDHIQPRSLGGTHDPSNLQLAHLRCNMVKSNRVPVEE